MRDYPPKAIQRSRSDALEWLQGRGHGYPRSRTQEDADTSRRGYDLYDPDDDPGAPPILGYEALEREGLAKRLEVERDALGDERIHFVLLTPL